LIPECRGATGGGGYRQSGFEVLVCYWAPLYRSGLEWRNSGPLYILPAASGTSLLFELELEPHSGEMTQHKSDANQSCSHRSLGLSRQEDQMARSGKYWSTRGSLIQRCESLCSLASDGSLTYAYVDNILRIFLHAC